MTAAEVSDVDPGAALAVLMVDPQVLRRFAYALELRIAGFHVMEASSIEEAMTLLKVSDDIGLVVVDRESAELVAWLREERSTVGVVFMNGATAPPQLVQHVSDR